MMGHQIVEQAALFYEFSLERHVPTNHMLRSIDRFMDLGELRRELSAFYSPIGRPSIAPELMIRMLLVGYCCGIRSERRLCEEVHLNLAYRWFCGLGLDGDVPDHSTFSKKRVGVARELDFACSELFLKVTPFRLEQWSCKGFRQWNLVATFGANDMRIVRVNVHDQTRCSCFVPLCASLHFGSTGSKLDTHSRCCRQAREEIADDVICCRNRS